VWIGLEGEGKGVRIGKSKKMREGEREGEGLRGRKKRGKIEFNRTESSKRRKKDKLREGSRGWVRRDLKNNEWGGKEGKGRKDIMKKGRMGMGG
jgi:hypothetical protein